MVAIFTGAGVGFERGSGALLGGGGLIGDARHGRSGEQVFLNAATGNLMITQRDEFLVGKGPDASVSRTYNSLGDLSDDNHDNWRQSTDRRVYGLTGTLNSGGSSVRRVSADGTDIVYLWNGTAYANGQAGGAVDKLTSAGGVWTWTDGSSQVTERYEASDSNTWRITRQTDTDGLFLSFSYDATSGKLTKVTTSDGGTISYGWNGDKISTVTTGGTGAGSNGVRTRYKYDVSGRLSEVRVDLTPDDGSDSDGRAYSTFYTYHGTTTRVASISQTDGSKVEFTYDVAGRVETITQTVATGVLRTTTISYQALKTIVSVADEAVTTLDYAPDGSLRKITAPPAQAGAAAQSVQFTYGSTPDLSSPIGSLLGVNSVTKTGAAGWGNQVAYGDEVMTGSAILRFRLGEPNMDGKYQQVGLATVANQATLGTSHADSGLAAGIYFDSGGTSPMLLAGSAGWQRAPASVTASSSDVWTVAYDGAKFHYLKNDEHILSVDAPPNLELVFKHRADSQGAAVRDISYSTAPNLISSGGSLLVADTITKTAVNGWNNQLVYSQQAMSGTAAVSFRLDNPINAGKWQQVGLTSPQWASYQGSNWDDFYAAGFYFWGDSNTIQVSNGDVWEIVSMTGTSADVWGIAYDGATFSFSKNGTVFKTMPGAPNLSLAFKYRSPSQGTVIRDIKLGAPAESRLAAVTDASGGITRYYYDAAGNVVREKDPLGNVVTRTYGSRNELRSETRRASAGDSADAPLTTYYAYDDELHLAYVVRPSGEVEDYRYHADGELRYSVRYTHDIFTVGTAAPTKADLDAWRLNVDLSKRLVTEHFYDARGSLQQTRAIGANLEQQDTHFTYDRAGQLLARSAPGSNVERFVYDGLGRVTASTDLSGGTTNILFRDAAGQTIVSLASGLIETSTYNKAGALIARTQSTAMDLMLNGDLATGTEGWTLNNATRVPGASAPAAFVFEAASGASVTSALQPLPAAETLLLTYVAKPQIAYQQFHTWAYWYDAQQNQIGSNVIDRFPASTTTFTTIQQQLTRPAGAAYVQIVTYAIGQSGAPAGSTAQWGGYKITVDNLIRNSALSANTDGWGLSNVARVAAPAGAPVEWVFKQQDANNLGIANTATTAAPETNNLYLSYSAQAAVPNQFFEATVFWQDANGTGVGSSSFMEQPSSTQFTNYEHQISKPLGATHYWVRLMAMNVAGAGGATAQFGALRLSGEPKSAGAASAFAPSREQFLYDKFGQLRIAADAAGAKTYFVYDHAGRKIASVDDAWRMTEFVYDANDRIVRTIAYANRVIEAVDRSVLANPDAQTDLAALRPLDDAGDVRTWQIFDSGGRLLSTIGNDGSVSAMEYDRSGRLVRTTIYAAKLTTGQLQQVLAAQPSSVVLPAADPAHDSVTRSFYDRNGRLIAALDGEGFLTRTFYDRAGQKLEEVRYADAVPATGTLRAEGTLAAIESAILAAGQTADAHDDRRTRFVYDSLGQLRFTLDGFNQAVEFVYDAKGRLVETSAYDGKLALTSFDCASVDQALNPLRNAGAMRRSFTVYDNADRVVFTIDAEGAVTGFAYDSAGRLSRTTRYKGQLQAQQAPSIATVTAWLPTDAASLSEQRITRSFYNARNELRYTIDAAGYVTRIDYDAAGRKTAELRFDLPIAANDTTTIDIVAALATGTWAQSSWTYDGVGQLTEQRDGEQRGVTYTYDGLGRLKSEQAIGAGESVKSYTYDKAGRVLTATVTSATNPADMAVVTYQYDAFGNVLSIKDARDAVTTMSYDRLGRLVERTDALTGTVQYLYNAFGDAIRVIDARNNATHNYYDRLGRLTLSVDALNYATATTYTTFGEVHSLTRYHNPVATPSPAVVPTLTTDSTKDATTSFTYDKRGLVLTSTDAESKTENYAYTSFGERRQLTNREGAVTSSIYDRRGLLVSETLDLASVNASGVQDAAQITNRFEYDARGNRTKTIEAEGRTEQRTTQFSYDKSNRLTETRHDAVSVLVHGDDAAAVQIVPTEFVKYDGAGRVVERIDALGGRTLYGYDFLGNVDREVDPLGTFTARTFDRNGNVTKVRVYEQRVTVPQASSTVPAAPAGGYRETTYGYDALNRLEKTSVANLRVGAWTPTGYETGAATVETIVKYDKNGNVLWQQDGTGARTYSWYDALDRKVAQSDAEGYFTAWTLDKDGNVASERRHATKVTVTGEAPALPGATTHADDRVTEFTYDRNGRRLSEKRLGVVAWAVDPATGALTAAPSFALIRYEYNGLGQVTKKTEANGDAVTYTYDKMGRLTKEERAAFLDSDGDSQTVTPTSLYSYDGLGHLTRTVQGGDPDAGTRVTRNAYGAGGRLLQSIDAGGAARSYAYDASGNVLRETYERHRSDGTLVNEAVLYVRDALGRVTMQTIAASNGSGWAKGDRIHTRYNAFGEVSERGVAGIDSVSGALQEQFAYDGGGRLWGSNSGDGVWRYYVYDKAGRQTLAVETEGATGAPLASIDAAIDAVSTGGTVAAAWKDGYTAAFTVYDKRGLATRTILPHRELGGGQAARAIATTRTYNAFGEVASETGALGHDAAGSLIAAPDERYTTFYAYNSIGRLIEKRAPLVQVTGENGVTSEARPTDRSYYDLSGRLVGIDDANGNRTTRLLMAGTGHGGDEPLVMKEFHPDAGIVAIGYDVFGDIRVRIDEINRATTMDYDAMGRLLTSNHPGGLTEHYEYDELGQRVKHWNSFLGSSNVERTDYDAQGRVVSTVAFGGDATTTAYAWDGSLATQGMGQFGGWTATTTYANTLTSAQTQDLFGREIAKRDMGARVTTVEYDSAGRMTKRIGGDTLTYTWLNTGLGAGVSRLTGAVSSAYRYDVAGNRTGEVTTRNGAMIQNAEADWDALGRLTRWKEQGSTTTPQAEVLYSYDAVGNVRRTSATYQVLDAQGYIALDAQSQPLSATQVYWNAFDAMNRQTVAKGSLVNGVITRGTAGVLIAYDRAGQRQWTLQRADLREIFWQHYSTSGGTRFYHVKDTDAEPGPTWTRVDWKWRGDRRETYSYNADGTIDRIDVAEQYLNFPNGAPTLTYSSGVGADRVLSDHSYDAMGRLTRQIDNGYAPDAGAFDRSITYNAKGQITHDTVHSYRGGDDFRTETDYSYGTGLGYALGAVTRSDAKTYKNAGTAPVSATFTDTLYEWWDGAQVKKTTFDLDGTQGGDVNTSDYFYDALGQLGSVVIDDARDRTVTFSNDLAGQILRRDEADGPTATGDPHEVFYRFGGRQIGMSGNNGTDEVDYQRSVDMRSETGSGAYRGGGTAMIGYANFAMGYSPVTSTGGGGSGSYTVREGETLSSIAANLWGDPALWYKLAEANGMTAAAALAEGQTLIVPAGVNRNQYNASTFRPYEAGDAMGDLSPTTPKPPRKNNCGVMGQVMMSVVAIAVTVVLPQVSGFFATVGGNILGGILSSAASQGFGLAAGMQDRFDWKSVAMAGVTAAVSAGLNGAGGFARIGIKGPGFGIQAAQGAIVAGVSQGIGVATGLQSKFDFAGIAAAGLGQGSGTFIGGKGIGGRLARIGADELVGAASRSVITGTSFGDNLLAVLPSVIGRTIGGVIEAGLTTTPSKPATIPVAATRWPDDGDWSVQADLERLASLFGGELQLASDIVSRRWTDARGVSHPAGNFRRVDGDYCLGPRPPRFNYYDMGDGTVVQLRCDVRRAQAAAQAAAQRETAAAPVEAGAAASEEAGTPAGGGTGGGTSGGAASAPAQSILVDDPALYNFNIGALSPGAARLPGAEFFSQFTTEMNLYLRTFGNKSPAQRIGFAIGAVGALFAGAFMSDQPLPTSDGSDAIPTPREPRTPADIRRDMRATGQATSAQGSGAPDPHDDYDPNDPHAPTEHERLIAREWRAEGDNVILRGTRGGPDSIRNGDHWEIKRVTGKGENVVWNALRYSRKQFRQIGLRASDTRVSLDVRGNVNLDDPDVMIDQLARLNLRGFREIEVRTSQETLRWVRR